MKFESLEDNNRRKQHLELVSGLRKMLRGNFSVENHF
jgi:hypothetical protein